MIRNFLKMTERYFFQPLECEFVNDLDIFGEIEVESPSNIAVVKYWGKSDEELNHPLNENISVTLSNLKTRSHIYECRDLDDHALYLNGEKCEITDRIRNLISYAFSESNANDREWREDHHHFFINSFNNFPTKAGLASSASGLSCLSFGICNLLGICDDVTVQSRCGRVGSGSACRSFYGGFVKWMKDEEGNDSYGVPLFLSNDSDNFQWVDELFIVIAIVNGSEKEIGSSLGMKYSQETSERLKIRVKDKVPNYFLPLMEQAIREKDEELFYSVMMEDCEDFHSCCLDTIPSLQYRNQTSFEIINLIQEINYVKGQKVMGYTFDAGPNPIIFTTNKNIKSFLIKLFENQQQEGEEIEIEEDLKEIYKKYKEKELKIERVFLEKMNTKGPQILSSFNEEE